MGLLNRQLRSKYFPLPEGEGQGEGEGIDLMSIASSIVFGRFLPPHPGLLPWGEGGYGSSRFTEPRNLVSSPLIFGGNVFSMKTAK